MYEESKIEFDWKSFLIKLALIIVVIILIVKLLPLENKNLSKNFSTEFNNNMTVLRESSSQYFISDRLPVVGESRKVNLEDLISIGAVRSLSDKDGSSCDSENSYVKVSNKTSNHELEIHLICGKEKDTVYVYFPKNESSPEENPTITTTTTKKTEPKKPTNGGAVTTTQKVVTSKVVKTIKPPTNVSIIFNSNGGTLVSTQSIKIGNKVIKPFNPVKTGYIFVGWFDTSNREYNFNLPVYSTTILKAKWVLASNSLNIVKTTTTTQPTKVTPLKITNQYIVTFNSNGGTSKSSRIVNYRDYVSRPSDPTRPNATFIGWYLGDSLFNFKTRITKNITLVARYVVTVTKTTSAYSIGVGAPVNKTEVTHTLAIPTELKHSSYQNVRIDSVYFDRSLSTQEDLDNYYRYWDQTYEGVSSANAFTSGKPKNFVYFDRYTFSIKANKTSSNIYNRSVTWSGNVIRTCEPFTYREVSGCLYGIKYNIIWKYDMFI
ncbi:MAG: InlB B-repeat-containing protein [Bacilli bacterium]|nr:InlB B-repeat-containing protein [Bacilli bacterium]